MNESGYDATFFAPHDWYKNQCKSGDINKLEEVLNDDSIILWHFCKPKPEFLHKGRHILSLRETNLVDLKQLEREGYLKNFEFIHYVSNSQRAWHKVNYPFRIIPEIVSDLHLSPTKSDKAGVIGSIDRHKQTHQSIQRAIANKHPEILILDRDWETISGIILKG